MKNSIFLLVVIGMVLSFTTNYFLAEKIKDNFIKHEKENLLSLAYASSFSVENYFINLKNIINTLSSSSNIQTAVLEFSNSFEKISQESSKDDEQLKKQLEHFYDKNYVGNIHTYIPNSKKIRETKEYISKQYQSRVSQHNYIVNNPFNMGEKYKLQKGLDKLTYNETHEKYHDYLKKELNNYLFYDLFLIDKKGNVVYSVDKEVDFATNLENGVFSNSKLASIYKKAKSIKKGDFAFEDYSPYEPSYNSPAAFLAQPIYKEDKLLGVLAIQIPTSKIDEIMSFKGKRKQAGLGDSGEVYLVGEDKLMRSNSRFTSNSENLYIKKSANSVGITKVDTLSVNEGLKGEVGTALMKDYRGINVFSAYLPIELFGKKFVLLSEIDEEEILNKLEQEIKWIFIASALILSFIIIGFILILYRYFIRPLQTKNIQFLRKVVDLDNQVLVHEALLNEYKKAVDASSIVSKTDIHGKITYINDEFSKISGYDKYELLGKSHNIIRHPNTPKKIFEVLWETINKKEIWKGVIQNKRKDGSSYFVNSTIVPILDLKNNISEFISIRTDITDLIEKEKLILKQTADSLTGLPNRIKLFQELEAKEDNLKLAILSFNELSIIDDFYGSEYSKVLIKIINRKIEKTLGRKNFKLFYLNSSELAVLVGESVNIDELILISKELIDSFNHESFRIKDDTFNVTITVGISFGKNLYSNALKAKHNAKEVNKSIVCYEHEIDMRNRYEHNRTWITKIKKAIHEDKIEVFIQPIVYNNGEEGPLKKYECLMRIKESDDQVISPFYFLEIAKEARLYFSLTKIIIEKSFDFFSNKEDDFSLNLTIEDIMSDEIVEFIEKMLDKYKIGNRVIFEIVESESIDNYAKVSNFIDKVRQLGCKIAIDDFGTGYSNFEYLLKLDADFIKIDGSLIKNINTDETTEVIVKLILEFARKFNKKTIAEYVHNEEVYKKVKELGIDYSQGYFLSEPFSISSLTKN